MHNPIFPGMIGQGSILFGSTSYFLSIIDHTVRLYVIVTVQFFQYI